MAVAGATLLAAACGESPAGADTFKGGTYAQSLAYAKCMRSHGVAEFPAPDGEGNFSNSQIESIIQQDPHERDPFQACRQMLPNEGTGLTVSQPQAMQQRNLRNAVKAAHCMRAHGIAGFPDPAGPTQGSGINWQPVLSAGLKLGTPSYQAAFKICSGDRSAGPSLRSSRPGPRPPQDRRPAPAAGPSPRTVGT